MRGTYWYWSYLYYLSKYYELLDTVILVLKKVQYEVIRTLSMWSVFGLPPQFSTMGALETAGKTTPYTTD